MLALHALSGPWLDALFRFSNLLGLPAFCVPLTLSAVAVHLRRGEHRAAWTWLVLGLGSVAVTEALKPLVGRPRPELWPHLVVAGGSSFPSGHALATAALFPFLGWLLWRRRPIGALAGALASAYVGLGRLYLGVHWPTDVLGGWLIGAILCASAARCLHSPSPRPSPG